MNLQGRPLNRAPGKGVFGIKLRSSRMGAGLTGIALADLLGVAKERIWAWETGQMPPPEIVEKLAQIFDWDAMPPPTPTPRKEAPVAVTHLLRTALSQSEIEVDEGDSEFSLRRLKRSAQYVADNLSHLVEQYEKTLREMHRLEQRMSGGLSVEQVETLRDKARRWDDLQAIMERKARA